MTRSEDAVLADMRDGYSDTSHAGVVFFAPPDEVVAPDVIEALAQLMLVVLEHAPEGER